MRYEYEYNEDHCFRAHYFFTQDSNLKTQDYSNAGARWLGTRLQPGRSGFDSHQRF
jgi:hypothetical protein